MIKNGAIDEQKKGMLQAGFTMVELAVVMIVIGLLVTGLFLGLNVVKNAKMKSTYSMVGIYQTALEQFVQKYQALPGDMEFANNRLALCGGAAACVNGDGNGVVGLTNQRIFYSINPNNSAEDETTMFWYHLAAAEMIRDVQMGTAVAVTNQWGQNLPAAPAGGGYMVRSMDGSFNDANGVRMMGIYLKWQDTPYAPANTAPAFVISPSEASWMDGKFDDGLPLSGKIRASGTSANISTGGADGCRLAANNGNTYDETNTDTLCYMFFQIRTAAGL